jgi:hypothetical protein
MALVLISGGLFGASSAQAASPCGAEEYWYAYGAGTWSCEGQALVGQSAGESLALSTDVLSDFQVAASVSTSREAWFAFRFMNEANGYLLRYVPAGVSGSESGIWLVRRTNGVDSVLSHIKAPYYPAVGQPALIKIVGSGANFQIEFNGYVLGSFSDATYATGRVGFGVHGSYARFGDVNVYSGVVIVASTNLILCDKGADKYYAFTCALVDTYFCPGEYGLFYKDGYDEHRDRYGDQWRKDPCPRDDHDCDWGYGKGKWDYDWKGDRWCDSGHHKTGDYCDDGHGKYGKWGFDSKGWKCDRDDRYDHKVGDRCDDHGGYGKWGYDGGGWKCDRDDRYDHNNGDRCDYNGGHGKWGYDGGKWKCDRDDRYDHNAGDRCNDGKGGYGKWGYDGGWKCDRDDNHHNVGDRCDDGYGGNGKWGYSGGSWKCDRDDNHHNVGDRCDNGYGGSGKWGYSGGSWKCDRDDRNDHHNGDDCYDGKGYGKWGYSSGSWKCDRNDDNHGDYDDCGKGGYGGGGYSVSYGKCNHGNVKDDGGCNRGWIGSAANCPGGRIDHKDDHKGKGGRDDDRCDDYKKGWGYSGCQMGNSWKKN